MKTKLTRHIETISSVVTVLALVLIVIKIVHFITHTQINSDSLYLVNLFRDFAVDHYSLRGWRLMEHRGLIPDGILFFPFMWLFYPRFEFVFLSYALVYIFAFAWIVSAILRIALPSEKQADIRNSVLLSCTVFFLLVSFSNEVFAWILLPTLHGGTLLSGIALVYLALKALYEPLPRLNWLLYLGIFALASLANFSDALYLTQFLVPVICGCVFIVGLERRMIKRSATMIAAISLGIVASGKITQSLNTNGWISTPQRHLSDTLGPLLARTAWSQAWHSLHEIGRLALAHPWFLIPFVIAVFISLKAAFQFKNKAWVFLSAVFLIQIPTVLLPPGLIGYWLDDHGLRYIFPVFVFGFFLAFIAIYLKKQNRLYNLVGPALAGIALVSILTIYTFSGFSYFALAIPYPDSLKCLDETAEELHLHHGLSEYWKATYLTHLSKKNLKILALNETLGESDYFNNPNWYYKKDRAPASDRETFQFIITDGFSVEAVEKKFGPPLQKRTCLDLNLYIYGKDDSGLAL